MAAGLLVDSSVMSPSGLPALHVCKTIDTANVSVEPKILSNTKLLPTVPPKLVQLTSETLESDGSALKQFLPIDVARCKFTMVK